MHVYLSLATVSGCTQAEADAEWRRAAGEDERDEIACIAWAVDDQPVQWVYRRLTGDNPDRVAESDLLVAFFRLLAEELSCPLVFVGHDVCCALRVLYQRAVVRGVRPPLPIPHDALPGVGPIYDTMTAWSGRDGYITLEQLGAVLGLLAPDESPGDDGPEPGDGAQTPSPAQHDRMAYRCQSRVELVRRVHRRLIFDTLPLRNCTPAA